MRPDTRNLINKKTLIKCLDIARGTTGTYLKFQMSLFLFAFYDIGYVGLVSFSLLGSWCITYTKQSTRMEVSKFYKICILVKLNLLKLTSAISSTNYLFPN